MTSNDFESRSVVDRIQRRLKWPFKAQANREMLERLQRQKSTINTALAADSVSTLQQLLSRQKSIEGDVMEIRRIGLNEKKRKKLNTFAKARPRG